ncbi:MAG: DNA helicase [Proteobacteria bacterium]|nr:MAG: DNA helicase [Pseudomonadota bacterium]
MDFLIADTFTTSLAALTNDEQKLVKTTAFDLQMNPASPGMRFHKLDRAKDKGFWSVRVGSDIRLIVHKTAGSLLLCYVDHHDAAYRWAERRRIERHPTTGAAQLVEIRETVREISVPPAVDVAPEEAPAPAKPRIFASVPDGELLALGVPEDWLAEVRSADEDTLLDLAQHLPAEAGEALLVLATGGTPDRPVQIEAGADPFSHPDAQRRFRVMTNADELAQALEAPWEKWIVFLHPAQRRVVDRRYGGPARVFGSAGTGKTIVALHRAVHLARANPRSRVLLTTFSETLANALARKLVLLVGEDGELRKRIAVRPVDAVGCDVLGKALRRDAIADATAVRRLLQRAGEGAPPHRFAQRFIESEWHDVVDAWQLDTWEAYRDVARLGRKTRIGEQQRAVLWSIFERLRALLSDAALVTLAGAHARATALLASGSPRPFDFLVVDEAQDLGVPHLRLLAALAGDRPDALFFAGDLGQRILQTPFSWRALGIDVRGRSSTLRINYRTSHEIRRRADLLLPPALSDVDGNFEERRGTISAFHGAEPTIQVFDSTTAEAVAVAEWLAARRADGVSPHEIALFVRSEAEIPRAAAAARQAGIDSVMLDGSSDARGGAVAIGTMHLAKGLEFRAVAVMACDDEILPSQERIESVGDDADLADVYDTERHLLYVACTRARDHLLATGVTPASEFLDDLRGSR